MPGANAGLSALICSGLDTTAFTFIGFLPKTGKKQQEVLEGVKGHRETLIFYEAPHHLKATLKVMAKVLGENRQAVLGRELTKKFEEFRRGSLTELMVYYEENDPRGEYVIIIEGAGDAEVTETKAEELSPMELCQKLMEEGLPKKEAMRETAKRLGLSRRDVYQAMLDVR